MTMDVIEGAAAAAVAPLCQCGCGAPVRGPRAVRFLHGHNSWRDPIERFWEKVEWQGDGCMLWTAAQTPNGYGQFRISKSSLRLAHVVSYEWSKGPIPEGLQIDHTCHDPRACAGGFDCPHRRCVNPAHLEAVTAQVNQLRGGGNGALNAAKTHCPAGHPYDGPGSDVRVRARGSNFSRECLICEREHARQRYAARIAA